MAAEEDPKSPHPFDVQTIRYLVQLMSKNDLSEIDLHDGEQRIRLRRGTPTVAGGYLPAVMPPVMQAPAVPLAATPPAATPTPAPAAPAEPEKKLHLIRSEMVGTFYTKPKPDAEPFVKVGTRVKPDTVVGLIEAMKLFNEVQAGCTGTVAEIVVENQQAVEFNTVLLKIELS